MPDYIFCLFYYLPMKQDIKNIITVGASAGGIEGVSTFLNTLSTDVDVAVFVVIHLPAQAIMEVVVRQLERNSKFPCLVPADGDEIKAKHVYIAPANKHMMLQQGKILIKSGAKENHWRPAIDVLFRSAAAAYDSCVIGVILTGLLDDGTSGMIAIKKSGGICIVQDPQEAVFSDMPLNVINNIDVDYSVSISEMGYIIEDLLLRSGGCKPDSIPEDVKLEAKITLRMNSDYQEMKELGKATAFTCPDCGGILTEIEEGNLIRYRCFTGHAFTAQQLEISQKNSLEDSLWTAIRMLEERRNLLVSLSKKKPTVNTVSKDQQERADDITVHIDRLKDLLKNIVDV